MRTAVDVLSDVGDADPAHAGDGDHRHPRDVDDHHPAGGAAPGADLRRPLRRQAGRRPRSGASCCARARSSTSTTGCRRIDKAAARLRELVPEARIAAAHGQMNEHQLEQVMVDFWETQVRRAGLHDDRRVRPRHPNANTLIVERADLLGLSQLHQLRGRVGRGRERGLRLLPLPAGEAAHRDRPRPARHASPSTPTSAPAWPSR